MSDFDTMYIDGFGFTTTNKPRRKVDINTSRTVILSNKSSDEQPSSVIRKTPFGDFSYVGRASCDRHQWNKIGTSKKGFDKYAFKGAINRGKPNVLTKEQQEAKKQAELQARLKKEAEQKQDRLDRIQKSKEQNETFKILEEEAKLYFNGRLSKSTKKELIDKRGLTEEQVEQSRFFTVNDDFFKELMRKHGNKFKKFTGFNRNYNPDDKDKKNKNPTYFDLRGEDAVFLSSFSYQPTEDGGLEERYSGAQLMPLSEKVKAEKGKYLSLSHHTNKASQYLEKFECTLENKIKTQNPVIVTDPFKEERAARERKNFIDNIVVISEAHLKPAIAAYKQGVQSLGCNGYNWSSNFKQILDYLIYARNFCPNADDFTVVIAPDAGGVVNTSVVAAIAKLIEKLQSKDFNVRILWYDQTVKTEDQYKYLKDYKGDIDEIGSNSLSMAIRNLNKDRRNQGKELWNETYAETGKIRLISVSNYEKVSGKVRPTSNKQWEKLVNKAKKQAEIVASNQELQLQAILGNGWNTSKLKVAELSDAAIWEDYKPGLHGVRSVMGSGKTQSLKGFIASTDKFTSYANNLIKYLIEVALDEKSLPFDTNVQQAGLINRIAELSKQHPNGEESFKIWEGKQRTKSKDDSSRYTLKGSWFVPRIYLLGHRNGLLSASCKTLKLQHREEAKSLGLPIREVNTGLCVDSILDIPLESAIGASFLIDEICSVLPHLLVGSTCQSKRQQLLSHFQSLLQTCLATGGRVVCLDANLSAFEVNQMIAILGDLIPYQKHFYDNNYNFKDRKWEVEVVIGAKSRKGINPIDHKEIISRIETSLTESKRIILATDAKETAKTLHEKFQKLDKRGIIVCSDTLTKENRAFLKNPDEFLKARNLDYLIFTPTIDAGLSITVDAFDEVYGLFFGIVSPNAASQMLGRYRKPVKRIIWGRPCRLNTSAYWKLSDKLIEALFTSEGVFKYQKDCILDTTKHIGYTKLLEKITNEDHRFLFNISQEESFNSLWAKLWAETAARDNYEGSNFRDLLIEKLRKDGQELKFQNKSEGIEYHELKDLEGELSEVKRRRLLKESQEIASAEVPKTFEELQFLSDSEKSNEPETRNQIKKGWLFYELGGYDNCLAESDITPELVLEFALKDRGDNLKACKTLVNIENQETLKQHHLNDYFKSANSFVAQREADMVGDYKVEVSKINALKDLGLDELVNSLGETVDYNVLLEKYNESKKKQFSRDVLRLGTASSSPKEKQVLAFVNRLLNRVKLKAIGNVEGGIQILIEDQKRNEELWDFVKEQIKSKNTKHLEAYKEDLQARIDELNKLE